MSNSVWAAAVTAVVGVATATAHAEVRPPERERVAVADVVQAPDGQYVVILKTEVEPVRFLPIWIGEPEAQAIRMRLERSRPPRPLTLNLLESVLASSNIVLLEIQIDSVKGSVFLGKVRLRQAKRTWELDARPSDAIGLAVGRGASIWVSRTVLDEASVTAAEVEAHKQSTGSAEPPVVETPGFEETL